MTAVESVVEALRDEILDGRLDAGEPLRETGLAERFGVNRHTIRAALQALAAERLVSFEAYRGARVRAFSDADVLALMEYRTAIEVEAARTCSSGRLALMKPNMPPSVPSSFGPMKAISAPSAHPPR